MIIQVADLLEGFNEIAPFKLAESWDNVGLLLGGPTKEVKSVMIGLDPTLSLLEEAIGRGSDTVITHHPCIFRHLAAINTDIPNGRFLQYALKNNLNIIACHTNFDLTDEGVSDALAALLSLEDAHPILPSSNLENSKYGLGRIGTLSSPLPFTSFLDTLMDRLDCDVLQVAGQPPAQVQCVAVCGGSGSDLAEEAFKKKADIYLSSEIKHSTAVWAGNAGFCIINSTHYHTEKPGMALLAQKLTELKLKNKWEIEILQSNTEKPPFLTYKKSN